MNLRLIGLLLLWIGQLFAAAPVHVELFPEVERAAPNAPFWVAARLCIDKGWHIGPQDPEEHEPVLPTTLRWNLPVEKEIWPAPQVFELEGLKVHGYANEVWVFVQLKPGSIAAENLEVTAKASWGACKEVCLPGSSETTVKVALGKSAVINHALEPMFAPVYKQTAPPIKWGLLVVLAAAFLGGVLLNFMPCVFPVISLKALSLTKTQEHSLAHTLFWALGILCFFWFLGGIIAIAQWQGIFLGWGFQLQYASVIAFLALLFFVMGLALFDFFPIPGFSFESSAGSKVSFWGDFLNGALATVVASPCTGPFLGSALGLAVTLPIWQGFCILTSVGLGMAFPMVAIVAVPKLGTFLPRPGAWMETFRQGMGWLMWLTVLWLLWVFAYQKDAQALWQLLAAFVVVGLGCWFWGKSRLSQGVFLLLCLFGVALTWNASSAKQAAVTGNWEPFSVARLNELRSQHVPVFVDYTAKWCLLCQANRPVLHSEAVEKALRAHGVVLMEADWTLQDPAITQALRELGRNAVPVYAIYTGPSSIDVVLLPQLLTTAAVISAIESLP